MKKQTHLHLIASIGGGLFFNYLFWMEKQALNLLLYSIFVLTMLLIDKEMLKGKKAVLAGAAHLLSALLVVFNHSELTVITWYISLAVFTGFVHFQSIRSIFTAILAAILQIVTAPFNLIKIIVTTYFGKLSLKPVLKLAKYIAIPITVMILFSVLYSIANPVFAKYTENITGTLKAFLTSIFNFFFTELSFLRFCHVIMGVILSTGIFITFKNSFIERMELEFDEQLRRSRKRSIWHIMDEIKRLFAGNLLRRTMALKTENTIAILSFTILNILLLFLNAIDISTLWLGQTETNKGHNLSEALHDGTDALILSIIMAMLVILYFFSGNLNFYRKSKSIRILAYVWILQNVFLISSVVLRDYQYIAAHGLTYKRIGVLVFLILCTIGLFSVYTKVARQKTFFYLCKINGFSWYTLLLVFSFVNWDVFIVNYNITHRKSITLDFDHLMGLSDKTLPLIHSNQKLFEPYLLSSEYARETTFSPDSAATLTDAEKQKNSILKFHKDLDKRIRTFKEEYAHTTWLSWNYRDWQTYQYITGQHL